jgi:cell division inhibitor SepF
MPGFWKKALIYLGLVEEEDELEPLPPEMPPNEQTTYETVRPIRPDLPATSSTVRRIGAEDSPGSTSTVAPRMSVHVVEPRTFNDAKEIGDRLKVNAPVILNLQNAQPNLARRRVDFASGLTYMAGGTIKEVGSKMFLLTPPNVEVSADEARELMADRGFFNQF